MMSLDKIYVVTSGDYSNYHIDGVYTDPVLAEEARKCGGGRSSVETYSLNPPLGHEHPEGMEFYEVGLDNLGQVKMVEQTSHGLPKAVPYSWSTPRSCWIFRMWARNPEHALKIAGEYRTRIKAANLWDMKLKYYGGTIDHPEFVELVAAAIG